MTDNDFWKRPETQPRIATAVLATCIVRSMPPEQQERFRSELVTAYQQLRDMPASIEVLEVLDWTLSLLKRDRYDF